jgi:hypothetical protein
MTETTDLYTLTEPLTKDELDTALLEMTGDLDKAQVLHNTLPRWMLKAPLPALTALEDTYRRSSVMRRNLEQRLNRLQSLDQFCIEKLSRYLTENGHPQLDVRCDYLERPRRDPVGVTYITGLLIETLALEKHSLVLSAMQNFSETEAKPGGLPDKTLIREGLHDAEATGITAQQFVGYCRALDLGNAYQEHVREVFDLPAPGESPSGPHYAEALSDVGFSKKADMLVDLHMALAKQHISQVNHTRLLNLINANMAVDWVVKSKSDGKPLIWQGLKIAKACLWSVLVFSEDTLGELAADKFIIYMPNDPVRPWFEYASLESFKQYLTSKLKEKPYLEFFERYLDELERLKFLSDFKSDPTLGVFESIITKGNFCDFFFRSCVGKIQLDARVLAVPTADVDEEARRQRLIDYLDYGLDILNVAGFFVPVLGQFMMGVAIGQLLGEVFEGVEDWSHGDNAGALKHLVSVVESIVAMVVFAVGGRVVGTLKRSQTPSPMFFENLEAVQLPDHSPRLWRPDFVQYRQPQGLPKPWVPNARGVHQANGQSYIQINRGAYSVSFDWTHLQWRFNHPKRSTAYRPPLKHNLGGGWQHIFERPHEWRDPIYTLHRLNPALADVPSDALQSLAAINQIDLADLQRLAMENKPLPERFQDAVARFRQHEKVLHLIETLGQEGQLDSHTARTQMLALPLMAGWPKGRFFELLDSKGNLLESHPNLAPFDYEDQSIHITEQQLKDGQVLETLLTALSKTERNTLLGETVTLAKAPALLKKRLLETVNDQHGALYRKLYEDYKSVRCDEMEPLCARFTQLPRNVAWEQGTKASSLDRRYLRQTRRVPLTLEQNIREVLDQMAEDQALMGLYWPPLADAATHRLTFGMLGRLAHWPKELSLQLREISATGNLLAQVGPDTAWVRRTIVHNDRGFQAFNEQGAGLNALVSGPDALLQSVVDCLSPGQRKMMNLVGPDPAQRLRSQLRFKSQDERERVPRYLWPERAVPEQASSCAAAQMEQDKPPSIEFAPALVNKMRALYPLVSEAERLKMLRDAGTDHLSRAKVVKALEEQFAQLHKTLEHWARQRPVFAHGEAPPRDWRLSRYQVRQSIERCWSRASFVDDIDFKTVPGLELDRMHVGELPTLPAEVNFDHVQQLSLRSMGLSEDISAFLEHFKNLRGLELADNQLAQVPEALSSMPALEHLNLARNKLNMTEDTRKRLASLSRLKALNLAGNPLSDGLDVSGQSSLRELILRDCRLTEFPSGVRRLPYLEHLDLRSNDIRDLPGWLFELPSRYARAVNLRDNPVSTTSKVALSAYRMRSGIGMGYVEDNIARIDEQTARDAWLADQRVERYAEKDLAWRALKNEPRSDALFNLMARLVNTADATKLRDDLERRIWRVLDATAADAKLRDRVFNRAAMPINCDDAAAANFSDLEVLLDIHEASRSVVSGQATAKSLLDLAKRLFRLSQVESFAFAHSKKHPETDGVEVSLFFRTRLAQTLDLPGQPKHLIHEDLAGVKPSEVEAKIAVENAERTAALLQYIVKARFWIDYLRQASSDRFDAVFKPFFERLAALETQTPPITEGEYLTQANLIMEEKDKAEATEIERLTKDQMRRAGPC